MGDQAESLRQQIRKHHHIKEANTISIVSGKGGVGKSNTALNFSIELQKRNKKVLLVDLDIGMGNIDILLGTSTKYTITDLFNEYLDIYDIIESRIKGLHYISGGNGLSEFFTINEQKKDYFYEQYNKIVHKYDYIVFDLGAGATKESLFFVLASDECLVVTTPEPTSITDAYSMIKHIVMRQRDLPIKLLMNRCTSENECVKTIDKFKQVIKQFLQVDITSVGMLPEDKLVMKAVIKQVPYVILNQSAPVSRAMQQIVTNFLTQTDQLNQLKPATFVEKLKLLIQKRL